MNRIHILTHVRKFKKELSECMYNHQDKKLIGIFYSEEKCKDTLERYKNIQGFRDYAECFQIDEFVIDSIYNIPLSEIFDQHREQKISIDLLYLIYFVEEFDDGHSDSKLLGVFSSQQKAENALKLIKQIPEMEFPQGEFEIYENKVDQLGWKQGFFITK